jgi:hypothetical protein
VPLNEKVRMLGYSGILIFYVDPLVIKKLNIDIIVFLDYFIR